MLGCRDMATRFIKTFAAALVSFTLSYYGVAWAVLQCLHEEGDLHAIAVSHPGKPPIPHGVALTRSSPNLECPGPACVIESMADSSSQSRSINLTGEAGLNFAASFAMRSAAGEEKSVQWRRSVFDGPPSAVPIYISLSILRV